MNNLKFILFSSLLLTFSVLDAHAQARSVAELEEATRNTNGNAEAERLFNDSTETLGIDDQTQTNLTKLKAKARDIGNLNQVEGIAMEIEIEIEKCREYSKRSSYCCQNPARCGGSEASESEIVEITTSAGEFSNIEGDLGTAASCLKPMPNFINLLDISKGEKKVCKMYREGADRKPGCRGYCYHVNQIANILIKKATNLLTQAPLAEPPPEVTMLREVRTAIGKLQSKKLTTQQSMDICVDHTVKGEEKAGGKIRDLGRTIAGLLECAKRLLPEDADVDAERKPTVIDPADASRQLSGNSLNLSKTGYDPFSEGGPGEDEFISSRDPTDDSGGHNANNNNPSSNKGGNPSLGGGFSPNSAANANATDEKKRRRSASQKNSSLINGYGKTRRGSSGGTGARNKNKFKFSNLSDEKKKEKKKAKAMAKILAAAGISPNSQDNIFERNTRRFVASSVKEKLFDARRNRKLWMR